MAFCCARGSRVSADSRESRDMEKKEGSFDYEPLNAAAVTPALLAQLRRHAILVRLALPAYAVAQGLVPEVHPTCSTGYSNYCLIPVVLVLVHHLFAESSAWAAAKSLCTQPELCVLRQLGVLRRRRRLVVLGLLQDLHLYANLMFPLVARGCDLHIHKQYVTSWSLVPVIGPVVSSLIEHMRFWGLAMILMGVTTTLGVVGLFYHAVWRADVPSKKNGEEGRTRMHGSDFVSLARYAEVALFPSIAALCEEMSEQRRNVYVDNDAGDQVQARRKMLLGRLRTEDFHKMELANNEEIDRVEVKQQVHLSIQIGLKVLIGVILQLWVQASFFELAYDVAGREAKYKVVAGMLVSAVLVFETGLRLCDVASKLGCIGVALFLLCALVIAWSAAKVYFGVICDDHVWNLSTGCVDLSLRK